MAKRLPQSRISHLIIYATPIFLNKQIHLFLIKRFQPRETSPPTLQPLSALQLCLRGHRMLLRDLWDRLNVKSGGTPSTIIDGSMENNIEF